MKILVTGGLGYIGSHTVVELLNNNYEVIVIDNLSNSKLEVINRIQMITGKSFDFYNGDILDKDFLNAIFYKNDIHSVIHFAGLKSVGESNNIPLVYYENNVVGTMCLLETMIKNNVKNIVFSSSATVYGFQENQPIDENAELNEPTNPYGRSKFFIEYILKDLYKSDKDFNIVILRYFNPIGAHRSGLIGEDPKGIPNNLMPYITQVAIGLREKLSVFGNDYNTKDGTGVRDYIHVCDLANGHVCALERIKQNKGLDIFNLGTGNGYSVLDIINTFKKVNDIDIPYVIAPRREGDIDCCFANANKALKELNFKCRFDLEDMCKDQWNWQKNNPRGYDA